MVRLETLTGRFPVYDLTVEGSHEFFANGLLTHNCLGYFTWMYHRFDQAKAPLGSKSILKPVGTADAPPEVELPRAVTTPDRMNLFVRELRARYAPAASRTKTILRAVG